MQSVIPNSASRRATAPVRQRKSGLNVITTGQYLTNAIPACADPRRRLSNVRNDPLAGLVEQQGAVRLFVPDRRGEWAETTRRDLGRNVERMVRELKKPILAVTEVSRNHEA